MGSLKENISRRDFLEGAVHAVELFPLSAVVFTAGCETTTTTPAPSAEGYINNEAGVIKVLQAASIVFGALDTNLNSLGHCSLIQSKYNVKYLVTLGHLLDEIGNNRAGILIPGENALTEVKLEWNVVKGTKVALTLSDGTTYNDALMRAAVPKELKNKFAAAMVSPLSVSPRGILEGEIVATPDTSNKKGQVDYLVVDLQESNDRHGLFACSYSELKSGGVETVCNGFSGQGVVEAPNSEITKQPAILGLISSANTGPNGCGSSAFPGTVYVHPIPIDF